MNDYALGALAWGGLWLALCAVLYVVPRVVSEPADAAFARSLFYWAGIWGGLFLAKELWAATEWPCPPPWNTLSWTVWQLAARSAVLAMFIAGGMFVLLLHFVLPGHWPRKSTRARVNEREGRR